jgi:hypothetical protein
MKVKKNSSSNSPYRMKPIKKMKIHHLPLSSPFFDEFLSPLFNTRSEK